MAEIDVRQAEAAVKASKATKRFTPLQQNYLIALASQPLGKLNYSQAYRDAGGSPKYKETAHRQVSTWRQNPEFKRIEDRIKADPLYGAMYVAEQARPAIILHAVSVITGKVPGNKNEAMRVLVKYGALKDKAADEEPLPEGMKKMPTRGLMRKMYDEEFNEDG